MFWSGMMEIVSPHVWRVSSAITAARVAERWRPCLIRVALLAHFAWRSAAAARWAAFISSWTLGMNSGNRLGERCSAAKQGRPSAAFGCSATDPAALTPFGTRPELFVGKDIQPAIDAAFKDVGIGYALSREDFPCLGSCDLVIAHDDEDRVGGLVMQLRDHLCNSAEGSMARIRDVKKVVIRFGARPA